MRRTTTLSLVAAAIITTVAAAAVIMSRAPSTSVAHGTKLFPDLEKNETSVAVIDIANHAGSFELTAKDGKWVLPAKGGFPVKPEQVRTLLSGMASLETVEAKTRQPELFRRLDLDDVTADGAKSVEVTLKDGKGAVLAQLLIGKVQPSQGSPQPGAEPVQMLYVRKPSDNQTWLASGNITVPGTAVEFLDRHIPDLKQADVAQAIFHSPDGKSFQLAREKPEDTGFKLSPLPTGMAVKSEYEVNSLAGLLDGLDFDDVAPAPATLPVAKSNFDYHLVKGGQVLAALLPIDKDVWVSIQASGPGTESFGPVKGWIYRLPAAKLAKMQTTIDQLVQPIPPKKSGS
jgi:hypothetical protein